MNEPVSAREALLIEAIGAEVFVNGQRVEPHPSTSHEPRSPQPNDASSSSIRRPT